MAGKTLWLSNRYAICFDMNQTRWVIVLVKSVIPIAFGLPTKRGKKQHIPAFPLFLNIGKHVKVGLDTFPRFLNIIGWVSGLDTFFNHFPPEIGTS